MAVLLMLNFKSKECSKTRINTKIIYEGNGINDPPFLEMHATRQQWQLCSAEKLIGVYYREKQASEDMLDVRRVITRLSNCR